MRSVTQSKQNKPVWERAWRQGHTWRAASPDAGPQLSLTTPGLRAGAPPRSGSPTAPRPPVLATLHPAGWRARPPKPGPTGNCEGSQSDAFRPLCRGPPATTRELPFGTGAATRRRPPPLLSSPATAVTEDGTERQPARSQPPPTRETAPPPRHARRPLRRSPPPPRPALSGRDTGAPPLPPQTTWPGRRSAAAQAPCPLPPPARRSLGLRIKMAAAGAGPGGSGRC